MTSRTILIAIACGLGTALMLFAPARMGSIGVSLAYLALVPLFISVLGFGTIAGIVSAVIAGIVVAVTSGLSSGFAVLLVNFLPAVWIGHSAGLAQSDDDGTYWFPVSDILFRLAIISAAVTFVLGYFLGLNTDTFGATVREMAGQFYENAAESGASNIPEQAQVEQLADRIVGLMPLALPASLLIMYVLNLSIGTRIARSQGWMLRPKDDIPATTAMPQFAVALFAVALGLVFLGGPIGTAGKVVAAALGTGFMLVGFATLHFISRGWAARGMLLGGAYASAFILFFPIFFFVMFGLAETLFGIRARRGLKSDI